MTKEDFKKYLEKAYDILPFLKKINSDIADLRKNGIGMNDIINRQTELSEIIADKMTALTIFIHKDYFKEFLSGNKTTINPDDERAIIDICGKEKDDYIEVRCDFWGPCCPKKYFESQLRIILVDWEAYSLDGEYTDIKNGIRNYFGGHKQAPEFPDYNSLEADTHTNAVDFCNRLLCKEDTAKDKTETMMNHICILEHNFFPALLNKSSDPNLIYKWAELFSEILRELLLFYEPHIVLGHRNYLGVISVLDYAIFNQALDGWNNFREKHSDQSVLGREIVAADKIHTGRYKCAGIKDEKGTIWIGYVHFSRNFWKGYRGKNIIYSITHLKNR